MINSITYADKPENSLLKFLFSDQIFVKAEK
jgi:hypothetical protein